MQNIFKKLLLLKPTSKALTTDTLTTVSVNLQRKSYLLQGETKIKLSTNVIGYDK